MKQMFYLCPVCRESIQLQLNPLRCSKCGIVNCVTIDSIRDASLTWRDQNLISIDHDPPCDPNNAGVSS